MINKLNKLKKFYASSRGNVALSAGLLALPLLMVGGTAFDYSYMQRLDNIMQDATDGATIAAAKEMVLANSDMDSIGAVAKNHLTAGLDDKLDINALSIYTQPSKDGNSLTIKASYVWKPFFLHYLNANALPLEVSATARLAGRTKICMIALDDNINQAIHLKKKASLNATSCAVYSNSSATQSIRVDDNATLVSGVTCAAGGVKAKKKSSFVPEATTDCPRVEDPLIGRPTPTVGACDHTDFEVNSGTHTLYPGTYCQGLKIKGTADVSLKPGVYVITGDKLEVTDTAKLEGKNVGFYLDGDKAKLSFKKATTISLTAPKSGMLAGILVFEDRAAFSKLLKHEITSDNARLLLGTIYLPNGTLKIDSEGPVADKSAYTAVIARAIELDEGPTLYLNSDYEATDVPVPEGLVGNNVVLAR